MLIVGGSKPLTIYQTAIQQETTRERAGWLPAIRDVCGALMWLPVVLFISIIEATAMAGAEDEGGDGFTT
jgi:hypothetical protein